MVRLTYSTGAPAILFSIAAASGTDQFGTAFPAGMRITGADGNTYRTERATFTATGQLVNSTSQTPVTGITGISVSAQTYHIRGMIIVDQGAGGAGSQAIRVTGPTVSSMNIGFNAIEGAAVFGSGVATAINGDLATGPIPVSTTGELFFDGLITFSAAGSTFGLACRCVTSNTDTWTLRAGSYLELMPV